MFRVTVWVRLLDVLPNLASSGRGLGAGTVVMLEFQIMSDAPAGAAFVDLDAEQGSASTWLQGADSQGQPFRFVLSPAPDNTPGSPLDGLVTIPSATGGMS